MYQNYCKSINFKTELISLSENAEGIKEVIFSVSGEKVYSKLKYESGVHRVQRVPKTESQGRIHTSTITVAVMPEASEIDFTLDMNDVKVDVFRASGAGGQHVNTTDSAVRLTHLPTGIVVTNQDQKSQIKNKDKAIKILSARIYDKMIREQKAQEDANRKGQIGTGDRSERIRTYNYPQGRLTDHRIGLTPVQSRKHYGGTFPRGQRCPRGLQSSRTSPRKRGLIICIGKLLESFIKNKNLSSKNAIRDLHSTKCIFDLKDSNRSQREYLHHLTTGAPTEHFTNTSHFFGHRFTVDNTVFLPRVETEILVESALPYLKKGSIVLDMGTGSGNIACTLGLEYKKNPQPCGL